MKFIPLILAVSVLVSCNGKKADPDQGSIAGIKKDTARFFEVQQYLQKQVNEVKTTPFFIYKIEITDNKKDSAAIDSKVFAALADSFLAAGVNDPALRQFYKEDVFHDQTTQSFTLSYTTFRKDLPVQSTEVLLNEEDQSVKRIFIRKFFNYGDSSAIEQLTWKPNSSFAVNRFVQLNDNSSTSKQTIVVWNDKR